MRLTMFLSFLILSFLYSNGCACDENLVNHHHHHQQQPCDADISKLCDLTASPFVADAFDQKTCLLRNFASISNECAFHLIRNPGIVDSCLEEIDSFCGTVKPGERRVLDCFMEQDSSLFSEECQLVMKSKSQSSENFYLRPLPAEIDTDTDLDSVDMDMDKDIDSLTLNLLSTTNTDSSSNEEEGGEDDEDDEDDMDISYYLLTVENLMLGMTPQFKDVELVLSLYMNALMKPILDLSGSILNSSCVLQNLRGFSLE